MDAPEEKYPDSNLPFWRSHRHFKKGWLLNLSRYSGELGLTSDAVALWLYLWGRQGPYAFSYESIAAMGKALGWAVHQGRCYKLNQAREVLVSCGFVAVEPQKTINQALHWDVRPGLRILLDIPPAATDLGVAPPANGDGEASPEASPEGTPEDDALVAAVNSEHLAGALPASPRTTAAAPRPTDIPAEDEMRTMTTDALDALRGVLDTRNRATGDYRYGVASGAVDMIIQERNLASAGMV
jgi:hypothetical protein